MTPSGTLSIRSYTRNQRTHAHGYHQIVVPLRGSMAISVADRPYSVGVGHCVITGSGVPHSFAAPEESRFLVADMPSLPANALEVHEPCVAIEADLLAFCTYAEVQLMTATDPEMTASIYDLFWRLVARQDFKARVDDRIARVVTRIEDELAIPHSLADLAAIACLSASQFKALFQKHMGMACSEYLARRRMEHAKTLLMNTDYPVAVVAAEVGYDDASAFSRRFRKQFGQSPRQISRG